MKLKNIIIVALGMSFSIVLVACNQSSTNKVKKEKSADESKVLSDVELTGNSDSAVPVYEDGSIKVYPANIVKEFPEAKLSMETPTDASISGPGEYEFRFKVEDYQLAIQTPMERNHSCANSEKGQHIHYIINNAPYEAHYKPDFNAKLMEGNNVVLAFLSRSYHESIKNGTAYVLKNFQVGESGSEFDVNAPHLFYSRPKGKYSGDDTKKILLDFYLINTELSANGHRLKVNIDDIEFTVESWQPYFVEGLSKGMHSFRIRLIDQSGNLVPGPFNDSGNREIELN